MRLLAVESQSCCSFVFKMSDGYPGGLGFKPL